MNLEGKRIGFVMTGSFCTFRKTIDELKKIVKLGAKVVPIMSENSYTMDTKFGKAEDFIKEIGEICRHNKIIFRQRPHQIRQSFKINFSNVKQIFQFYFSPFYKKNN